MFTVSYIYVCANKIICSQKILTQGDESGFKYDLHGGWVLKQSHSSDILLIVNILQEGHFGAKI